jgi:multidrug efflux system membrane fusion protein
MSVDVHPVRAAALWQGDALIERGLAAGERVVIDGQYKMRPGVRVNDIEQPSAVLDGPVGGCYVIRCKSATGEGLRIKK